MCVLVEWGRPSSTCRRALFLPGVRAASDEHELQIGFASTSISDLEFLGREAARRCCCRRSGEGRPRFVCLHLHPLPSFLSFVFTALFTQQASREAKPCVFQCNAFLLLEKGAGETRVGVSQHHIPFKKKHGGGGGGHMRGSNQSRRTTKKAATTAQQRQQEGEKGGPAAAGLAHCVALAQQARCLLGNGIAPFATRGRGPVSALIC